jgi:hypothetical protein
MGCKISLGSISFGINFSKLCRTNFVTPKLQVVYCSTIEKKDKFFPLKSDTFQKYVGCRKVIVATLMLLSMSDLTTNMHPITRRRGFTKKKFIVNMHLDSMKIKTIQNNLVLFGEFELIFGLP